MCMKNVNATIFTCVETQGYTKGVQSLIGLYDSIIPKRQEEDKFYLENLNVVLDFNIIFSKDESKNEFVLGKSYDFKVRLTHVDSGCGVDLHKFTLSLNEDDLTKWCRDFYESTHTIQVPYIFLPKGLGRYALKLLVKEKDDADRDWTVQTIKKLIIGASC